MIKITNMVQFKRHTNLLPYYDTLVKSNRAEERERLRLYYAQDRDVTLMLIFGRDANGTPVAKIKCPINPLPITGEFAYTSFLLMIYLIKGLGLVVDSTQGISNDSIHILVSEVEKSKENWDKRQKEALTF